jgi:hypothetical protein
LPLKHQTLRERIKWRVQKPMLCFPGKPRQNAKPSMEIPACLCKIGAKPHSLIWSILDHTKCNSEEDTERIYLLGA